jgi:hypothetical protein
MNSVDSPGQTVQRINPRLLVVFGLLTAVALIFVGRFLNATKVGGQRPAEPFRIAGNFYYVGANDVSAFLIAGPMATSCWTPAIPPPRR